MTVKRKDFQKTAAFIHQFLQKLSETPECAELRDALNLALLHMQKYFRWTQRRRDSESKDRICEAGSLSNASHGRLSPMTPITESPDKMHWRWLESDATVRVIAEAPPPILEACKLGDLSAIKEMHMADPSCVEQTDSLGRTPLMYAARYEQSATSEWLLGPGSAKPNVSAHDQSTALQLAAQTGNWRLVDLLLRHRADPNARDAQGRAAIHWSVTTQATDCLKILLKSGADPSIRDLDDASATMWACRLDNVDHVSILRRSLVSQPEEERDSQGRTAVHWAVRRHEPLQCLKALISQATGSLRDYNGKTVLVTAAEMGSLPACRLILEVCGIGAANTADKDQRTAVHLATLGGHGEVLNFLLDQGAEMDARDKDGATAWDYAKQRRLHYCKLILASHCRQRNRPREGLQEFSQAAAADFPMPQPPLTPPTPRSKSPCAGRRRLKVAVGIGISREGSQEAVETAAAANLGTVAAAAAADAGPPAGLEVRRASEPIGACKSQLNSSGNSESPHEDVVCRRASTSPPQGLPQSLLQQRLHQQPLASGGQKPRRPLGSPDRRRLVRPQAPYRLAHRPASSDDNEEAEAGDPEDAPLPPPPPQFQAVSGDNPDEDESGQPPLDTAREPKVAHHTPSSSRNRQLSHCSATQHQQPQLLHQLKPAAAVQFPAQLQPLPAAYMEAAASAAAAAADTTGSGRRRGSKKRRSQSERRVGGVESGGGVNGGASSIVPERENRTAPSAPAALPPPPEGFADDSRRHPDEPDASSDKYPYSRHHHQRLAQSAAVKL